MKYQIIIVVEGGEALKHDIEAGHVKANMQYEVFPFENILSFSYKEMVDVQLNDNNED